MLELVQQLVVSLFELRVGVIFWHVLVLAFCVSVGIFSFGFCVRVDVILCYVKVDIISC